MQFHAAQVVVIRLPTTLSRTQDRLGAAAPASTSPASHMSALHPFNWMRVIKRLTHDGTAKRETLFNYPTVPVGGRCRRLHVPCLPPVRAASLERATCWEAQPKWPPRYAPQPQDRLAAAAAASTSPASRMSALHPYNWLRGRALRPGGEVARRFLAPRPIVLQVGGARSSLRRGMGVYWLSAIWRISVVVAVRALFGVTKYAWGYWVMGADWYR